MVVEVVESVMTKLDATYSLTPLEREFLEGTLPQLPPVVARTHVPDVLGGLVAKQTLANADRVGRGPKQAYKIGERKVAYHTGDLLVWLIRHNGMSKVRRLEDI